MYLFLRKCVSFVLMLYIFLIAVIFPLFVTGNGYTSIGWDKFRFYRHLTIILLVEILLLAILLLVINHKELIKKHKIYKNLSMTEWAVAGFLLFALLSLAFSSYRFVAWNGNVSFFMGLEIYLLILLSFIIISRFWKHNAMAWLWFLLGSGLTFILGILNRFSIWPFDFKVIVPEFLSTIGNYNLFAGYFAVLWPIGAGLYMFTRKRWIKYFTGFYTLISFCLGIILQADSAFLSFAVVFFILLLICHGKWERYGASYLELVIGFCFANQLMRLLRHIFPERFSLVLDNNIGAFLTTSSFSIYIFILILIPYLLIKTDLSGNYKFLGFIQTIREKLLFLLNNKLFKRFIIIFSIMIFVSLVLLIIINTVIPEGILGLANVSLLVFDDSWGNSRGINWKAAIIAFGRMNLGQKLIGIGPDCYAEYLYGFDDLASALLTQLNGAVVMNAHNEILTMLVNNGIVGLVLYIAIFISFILRFIKNAKSSPYLYIPAICVLSYLLHNLVSFGHIMNITLVFIIMAVGESYMCVIMNSKQENGKKKV